MHDKKVSVTRSPKLAAMGVATLSGLTPNRLEIRMTEIITIPSNRLAIEAVISELAHSRNAWWISKVSIGIQRNTTAQSEAMAATTSAWACVRMILPCK